MSWDASFEAPDPGVGIGLSQFTFDETSGRQEVIEELKKLEDNLAIRPAGTPRMFWITCGCLFVRWATKLTR
jgi:hypothetical protein